MSPPKIAIVLGSTRPNRSGEAVARWVLEQARRRQDASWELVDVAEQHLPLLDEPIPPSAGRYTQPHTKAWATKVASYDGYVFVTAEYNHGMPAALKNAIDFVYAEWNNKAAGFVSYGSAGGVRAVEQFRGVMAEIQVADVRTSVALSLMDDFENFSKFKPRPLHERNLTMMFDQVVRWSTALRALRTGGAPGS